MILHEKLRWMERSYCRSHDEPDMWFPTSNMSEAAHRAQLGCLLLCPVLKQCALYALRADFPLAGIWASVFFPTHINQQKARAKLYRIAKGLTPPITHGEMQ